MAGLGNFFRGYREDQAFNAGAGRKQKGDASLVQKLEKEGRYPKDFDRAVDMTRVSMDVMKPWITKRITELLGFEDDIVVEFCIGYLQAEDELGKPKKIDPKLMQVQLTGFMERKAAPFCKELWANLLSAQDSPVGVPQAFLDEKKQEMKMKRDEADRVSDELKRRRAELERAQLSQKEAEQQSSGGAGSGEGGSSSRVRKWDRPPPESGGRGRSPSESDSERRAKRARRSS